MCGITALYREPSRDLRSEIAKMTSTLSHRGPDDEGTAVVAGGVALGMRRLSIVDLAGGRQPMSNEDGTRTVVFNGEIYNAAALRVQLERLGHEFSTDHSDTEVIVHGYEEWGTDVFPRLNGMFAIALWDSVSRRLIVARDRAGEKPLYLARLRDGYAVASELKALFSLNDVGRDVDVSALEQYLAFDYVVGPRTMIRGVEKLPAASFAVVSRTGFRVVPYWTPCFDASHTGVQETIERLDALLDDAVRARMVADVPLGLFLSGGLDSSTVGYYMRKHSDRVTAFSIGFEEARWDETPYASLVAKSLELDHHIEVFSQDRIRSFVPKIADILDEPMGDQSIFPTYLLSTFTRQHVKVALGGDGSDELLMGYKAYQALKVAWELEKTPRPVRAAAAAVARRVPHTIAGRPVRGVQFVSRLDTTPSRRLLAGLGGFRGDARAVLSNSVLRALPADVFSEPEAHLLNGRVDRNLSPANQTILTYIRGYLQEDILVKVDRASMAASLEVRSPFLDPRIMDFSLAVPPETKMPRLDRKRLLRTLMRHRLPERVVNRPKMGFGVPLSAWLRESLLPLTRDMLSPQRLQDQGLFDARAVGLLVEQHARGDDDHGLRLWPLLQFQLWWDRWVA